MKKLVLAEKPSVGKDIARVLGAKKPGNGYMEGNGYIVTWALGHLVTLSDPDDYKKEYKNWQLEHLPIIPPKMKLKPIGQTFKQYKVVTDLMRKPDIKEIVIATDAGREGELVARWIIEFAKINKPIKRLWISSVTDKAIKEGFSKLKNGKDYENLYYSANSRAVADWLVGINATRALTTKFNAQLSCGRVQTPTIAIIKHREDEIRSFKAVEYYGVQFLNGNVKFNWVNKDNNSRIYNKENAESILKKCKASNAKIRDIVSKHKSTHLTGLYDLTTLQRDANRLFGFSTSQTLDIAQALYERHKLTTYPRTDSKYLSSDIVDTIKDRLRAVSTGEYRTHAQNLLKNSFDTKRAVNNAKVTDHHAIIPTEEAADLSSLSSTERRIYDLIVKRFLALLSPAFEYEETQVTLDIAGESFTAKGKVVKKMGYKEIFSKYEEKEEDDEDQKFPNFKKSEALEGTFKITTGKTKPPAYFTEGTLLGAMENPTAYVDKSLVNTLKEAGGIGTVATRSDIIEKLINSFMIEPRDKHLFTTAKGRQLLEIVPGDLKTPALTARWEQKLTGIAQGKLKKEAFIEEIKTYTEKIIKEIKDSEAIYKHDNITNKSCPECSKKMLRVRGKRGEFLICQDRECGTRIVEEDKNKPKRERYTGASKSDINKYLNNKEDKPINNALASQLAGLKFD
ncbi:MAG: DNA topoisomerase III [Defluviitaleaceae bacterium]|nr:DNA topoisomerase III [Defluviitaleaceae bacterium]